MSWIRMYGEFAQYRGFRFLVRDREGLVQVLLVTDNSSMGREVGFHPNAQGEYTGWVSMQDITQLSNESWFGELDGQTVWILGEQGDHYHVHTRGGTDLATKWGLDEVDRNEWGGTVPKGAISQVWSNVRWVKPPR